MLSTELINKMDEIIEDCMGDAPPFCSATCPLHIDARGYIKLINEGKYKEALSLIRETTPFAGILGRVCAHPCEEKCKRQEYETSLSIKNLKRFAADYGDDGNWIPEMENPTGKKVAIIGSGPAGAQAAFELAKKGHEVTIYEALPVVGGMLRVGIPAYRLPEKVIDYEYSILEKMGIEIKLNTRVGKDVQFSELENNYDAVFVAIGAHKSIMLPLEGSDLDGILPGADFLREVSLTGKAKIGKRVVVIGGGNVAMDVARTAWRVGAEEINVVCLESRDEMPAHSWEVEDAEEEGIKVHCSWGPMKFNGKDKIESVTVKKCTCVFDEEGKFNPRYDENEIWELEADTVIMAIGQKADSSFLPENTDIELGRGDKFKVDPVTLQTNNEKIFAGGDGAGRPLLAIEAMSHGHKAAISIDRYLKGEDLYVDREHEGTFDTWLETEIDEEEPRRERVGIRMLPVEERRGNFKEVEFGFNEAEAKEESERCLQCECKLCVKECIFLDSVCEYPKELFERVKEDPEADIKMPYYCNLCDLCTVHCPKDFELSEIFLQIRRELVEAGKGPLKEHNPVTKFHQPLGVSNFFTLTTGDTKAGYTKRVFFPGCSFSSYAPDVVESTYKYLQEKLPGTGFILRCCAAPTMALGEDDKFERMFQELIDEVRSTGATEIITACPDCTHNIEHHKPEDIKVTPIYDVLAEIGIPEERKGIARGKTISIHDSCTARNYPNIHDSVRKIAGELGLEIQELEYIRENTRCCGFGGMVVPANPDLATKVMARRAAETDKDVVTYCAACRESMMRVDKDAFHILEIVFGDWKDQANPVDNPLKQWFNRWKTKNKVQKISNSKVVKKSG